MDRIISQFNEIYGPGKGVGIYTTVMPGILSDFNRMLDKAGPGEKISEQYNTEDRRAIITVTGTKSANGQNEINMKVTRTQRIDRDSR